MSVAYKVANDNNGFENNDIKSAEGLLIEDTSTTDLDAHQKKWQRNKDIQQGGSPSQQLEPSSPQFLCHSILKSSPSLHSGIYNTDSGQVSPHPRRKDAQGRDINGVKSKHHITFNEEHLLEVNVVENWKEFNAEAAKEPACACSIF